MRLGHAVTAVETGDDVVRVRGDAFELAARRRRRRRAARRPQARTPAFSPAALAAEGACARRRRLLALRKGRAGVRRAVLGTRRGPAARDPSSLARRRRASKSSSRSIQAPASRRDRRWYRRRAEDDRLCGLLVCDALDAALGTRPRGTVVECFGRGGRGTSSRRPTSSSRSTSDRLARPEHRAACSSAASTRPGSIRDDAQALLSERSKRWRPRTRLIAVDVIDAKSDALDAAPPRDAPSTPPSRARAGTGRWLLSLLAYRLVCCR